MMVVVFDSAVRNFSAVVVVTVVVEAFPCIRMKMHDLPSVDSLVVELIGVVAGLTETNFCGPFDALLAVAVNSSDLMQSEDDSWVTMIFADILEMLVVAVNWTQTMA